MQRIDINTTQNVTIQYESAPWKDRVVAYFIDMVVLTTAIFIMALFMEALMPQLSYLFTFLILFFYTLAFEVFNQGQSLGKKAMNIKVVKLNGKNPTLKDYALRWAFRLMDIYFSFGIVASVLIGSSNKSQRLGDIMAHTTVIRVKPSLGISLASLKKINTLEHYKPTYEGVTRFNETDIILIKDVLSRVKQYPNQAHRMALNTLVDTVRKQLDLDKVTTSKETFLQTVIKDYVVLTR